MDNPFQHTTAAPAGENPSAPVPPVIEREPVAFSGRGSEYFGIWIVNLALTLITLGIYSAWAKVRRLQYFYRNTTLGGAAFDYHGDPRAILKGRVIGVALLLAYNVSFQFSVIAGVAVAVLLAAVMPVLLMRSLRFRAHYSSWRGLRFGFDGDAKGAYRVFLLWPVATFSTAYLLGPLWHQRLKRYQIDNARFGTAQFSFHAPASAFYRMYALIFLTVLLGLIAIVAAVTGLLHAAAGASDEGAVLIPVVALFGWLAVFLLVQPYLLGRLQNIVWNHIRLGPHRFESRVRVRRLYAIMLTNLVGVVCTLGLFMPFAAIRLARYRLESVTMLCAGPFDDFIAGRAQDAAAVGEEAADLFDVDIAL
jgi:uncharacterized membrane protein YjgN (DUF898 family)